MINSLSILNPQRSRHTMLLNPSTSNINIKDLTPFLSYLRSLFRNHHCQLKPTFWRHITLPRSFVLEPNRGLTERLSKEQKAMTPPPTYARPRGWRVGVGFEAEQLCIEIRPTPFVSGRGILLKLNRQSRTYDNRGSLAVV